MRLLLGFVLCLSSSATALSQAGPLLRPKGNVTFQTAGALRHKLLGDGRTLLLVGTDAVHLLDTAAARVVESRAVSLPRPTGDDDWVISPDGRKMLVVGYRDRAAKAWVPASVWDLQTGGRIAVLDRTTKPVLSGSWSEDGRTLLTYDHVRFPAGSADNQDLTLLATFKYEAEVTFWDGDTFERRSTLPAKNLTWWYLTGDGERFLFSSGTPSGLLGLKYVAHKGDAVSVWDTRAGRVERVLPVAEGYFLSNTRKMAVSPDGKLLAVVQKHKSNSSPSKLALWDIGRLELRYEVTDPRLSSSSVRFSPDGKYIALDAGSDVHVYETASGEKRFELPHADPPDLWLDDDRLLLVNDFDKMKVFDVAGGRQVYEQKLVTKSVRREVYSFMTDLYGNPVENYGYETVDYTRIVPHPGGRMLLTYSSQYVRVSDARTGELLQLIVSSPVDYSKRRPKVSPDPLVESAGWSDDGRTLYIINSGAKSAALWEMPGGRQ